MEADAGGGATDRSSYICGLIENRAKEVCLPVSFTPKVLK